MSPSRIHSGNVFLLLEQVQAVVMEKAMDFHANWEAAIARVFNLDETEIRILNADGAPWLKKVKDKSMVFQLDPFHKYQAIRENISDKKVQEGIRELIDSEQLEKMFEYITIYRNSLDDDKEIEKAQKLLEYFKSNRNGLRPYQKQIGKLPERLEYLNMGKMENHVWRVIARRVKHNHTSWSKRETVSSFV